MAAKIPIKPRGKLRKKSKKTRSLGALVVLGGLLLAGYIAHQSGPQRSPLVWEDFETRQGIYLGTYVKGGKRKLAFETRDGLLVLALDPTVSFKRMPLVGVPCQVSYTKGEFPTLVRSQDLKMLDVPDGAGHRYEPWR